MKYLKLTRCNGIYEYIPLDIAQFGFVETDNGEYRVEICFGKTEIVLFEKLCITNVDKYMEMIMKIPDGEIVEPMGLY